VERRPTVEEGVEEGGADRVIGRELEPHARLHGLVDVDAEITER